MNYGSLVNWDIENHNFNLHGQGAQLGSDFSLREDFSSTLGDATWRELLRHLCDRVTAKLPRSHVKGKCCLHRPVAAWIAYAALGWRCLKG